MADKKKSSPLLTKKEWLDYIDKLITRENVKNSKSGITIWVILGALSVLLTNIINLLYNIKYLNVGIALGLFCILSLILVILYVAISTIKVAYSPVKEFFPSLVENKKDLLFSKYISFIMFILVLATSIALKDFISYFYHILILLLFAYMQIEVPEYVHKEEARLFHVIYFQAMIFIFKVKKVLRAIIIILCIYLIYTGYKKVIGISQDMLLLSLYCYSFICLIIYLIYTLSGNLELKYLKKIESKLIACNLNENDIQDDFSTYFIGLYMYQWANKTYEEFQDDLEDTLKEQNDVRGMLNDKPIEEISDFSNIDIDGVLNKIQQAYKKYIQMHAFTLNVKLYFLFTGISKEETKLIDLNIKAARILKITQKSQIRKLKKIKNRLSKPLLRSRCPGTKSEMGEDAGSVT